MSKQASFQARSVWRRFCSWYGADAVERKYGLQPPDDWAEVVDSLDRDVLDRTMADIRAKYPTWMPSLPEFETVVRQSSRPVSDEGPTVADKLSEFVLRTRGDRLTPMQRFGWTFLYRGNPRTGEGLETVGVIIPADRTVDPPAPSHRVMVEDMLSGVA